MKANDPGGFSERLTLLPPLAVLDGLGGKRSSDGEPVLVWARFERAAGDGTVESRRPASDDSVELTIRRRSGELTGWAAMWRGRRYRVAARIEREAREFIGLRLEGGASA